MFKSILLNIPHSSTYIPETFGNFYGDEELLYHVKLQTDSFTDELFQIADNSSVKTLLFEHNRYYCDVERYWNDCDEKMSLLGQGAYYIKYPNGNDVKRIDDKENVRNIYLDYHNSLDYNSKYLTETHGNCLIVDCHSFNNKPIFDNNTLNMPDICIGINDTDNYILINAIGDFFKKHGLSVAINHPYSGSIYPSTYKNNNLKSIMIEINKDLYLKNGFGFHIKEKYFYELKSILSDLINNVLLV